MVHVTGNQCITRSQNPVGIGELERVYLTRSSTRSRGANSCRGTGDVIGDTSNSWYRVGERRDRRYRRHDVGVVVGVVG